MINTPPPIVPFPMLVNTGEEEGPGKIRDEFFSLVLSYLGYDEHTASCFTSREIRGLTIFEPGPPIPTDDGIVLLIAQDVLVASTIYRRNQLNYVCVSFAHYLDESTIKRVRFCPLLTNNTSG